MLLYPAMKDLLKNIPSRYLLVNIVAARARKISSEAEQACVPLTEKAVTIAIQEVARGDLRLDNAQTDGEEQEERLPARGEDAPAPEEDADIPGGTTEE